MSDTKAGKGDRLAEAMAQAMEAVEAREAEARTDEPAIEEVTDGASEDGEVEVEVEGDDAPPPQESPAAEKPAPAPAPAKAKDAGEAVTEALLKAKNELEDLLERSKGDAAKLKNKWLRAAADLENYKKRARRERDDIVKFGSERIIKDMLPVLDDMDRTVEVMETSAMGDEVKGLLEGVKMVRKKFLQQLEKNNVTTFVSKNTAFDPSKHEAVQQVHSDEVDAGGVAAELRRGFFLNERLLRPAMVTVSLGAAPAAETSAEADDAPQDESDDTAPESNDASAEEGTSEDGAEATSSADAQDAPADSDDGANADDADESKGN